MKKEDLIKLKKHIASFTKEEQKIRRLYLRKVALGEIEGPVSGYPSIDQPWLKYYDEKSIMDDPNIVNVYKDLYDRNKDYMDQVALIYFGANITFKQLFEKIDSTAKSLAANGVKKGDFVTICAALTPEIVYAFYALAKMGAVANFMSPYFDKSQMVDRISDCDSKVAIVMDSFYQNVGETLAKSNISKVILLPTLNSSPLGLMKESIKPFRTCEVLWNDFIKEGEHVAIPETVDYEKDMALAMVYSSGTTGASKSILLTHDSFGNTAFAYPRCHVALTRGAKYYQIIPPWFSTGISTSTHLTLVQGGTLFMDPRFDREVFVNNMLEQNPAGTIASITLFQAFLDEKLLKEGNLSNLDRTFQGGEKMEMQDKENIEKVFRRYNSNAVLMNGYGQCECGAGITTQTPTTPLNNSVGIPIPGVKIGIFDEENNELPYNTRGEIFACTPCGMKEYYKNPKATENYFYYENGEKWSRTGDIGSVNENGELEIYGRACDFEIINGKKIYNFDIEASILKNRLIQSCDVFKDDRGVLVAHIILKNTDEEVNKYELIRQLQDAIYADSRDTDYVPCKFKFRKSFPIMNFSKKDVNGMKKETEGFIEVEKYQIPKVKKLEE